ncbi:MAG: hydroxymethylglutaryl-CoA reductase, degradative [bacterium]
MRSSAISGFYKKSMKDRLALVQAYGDLSEEESQRMGNTGALDEGLVDRMIENVVGVMPLPLGIAVNFVVNGEEILVPMAIEEPSVVAAASNAAKMARSTGGFQAETTDPVMIGQIQLVDVPEPEKAEERILKRKEELLELCNAKDPILVKFGGGARDVEVRILDSLQGTMVVVHLLVDCRDAMGANAVNTMAEAAAPFLEETTGGRVYLRIISNLAVKRLARAHATWPKEAIGGAEVVEGVLQAYAFAAADPYRAATHNKGVMNGIDAVVIATGNDWRAIESGAHAYAAMDGHYKPLTTWDRDANGDLVGSIEVPMAVGLVGGATAVHPTAKANVKLLGIKTAQELAQIIAAVGLAQNFAALRALATEGIQRGHMSLHARNIAVMAGASLDEVDEVVRRLVAEKEIRMDRAEAILKEMRSES